MADVEKHLEIMDEAAAAARGPLLSSLSEALESAIAAFGERGLPGEINGTLTRHVRANLDPLWRAVTLRTMALTEEDLGLKADVSAQFLEDYVESFGNQSVFQIVRTTERQVSNSIALGLSRGLSQAEIVADLREQFPRLAETRAEVIVRTESHAISQYTSQRRAQASGYALRKRWNTAGDERVRDFGLAVRISQFSHRAMAGAEVALDQRFLVPMLGGGTEALLFPGDPAGSAGNIINCRCIQTYVRRA